MRRDDDLLKAIVAIDDGYGLMFNHRRQSRDKALISDIYECILGSKLYIYDYTSELFNDYLNDNIIIINKLDAINDENSYIFFESGIVNEYAGRLSEIVIYRWNRAYPGDEFFEIDMSGFILVDSNDFEGNCHEKITRERYVRKIY